MPDRSSASRDPTAAGYSHLQLGDNQLLPNLDLIGIAQLIFIRLKDLVVVVCVSV